jgi:hypothetical protein
MNSPDGSNPFLDIMDTPDIIQVGKPFTLFRILGYECNLIDNRAKRLDQPFDEGLAKVTEKVLLHAIYPAGFPPDQHDSCSHGFASGFFRDCIRPSLQGPE